jgi:hypothetical protein
MKTLRNAIFMDLTDSIVEKYGGDDDNYNRRKGMPKKVFWYFPIVPRLKRWFANKKESKLLRWHKEKHKQDVGMIRHPADATQ